MKRLILIKFILVFSFIESFSQTNTMFEILDFSATKNIINGDLKSGEILFFVAPRLKGEPIIEMEVYFELPNNVVLYNKDRFNNQNQKAYSPIKKLISRTEKTIRLQNSNDIEAGIRSGWFYFYVVPIAKGSGNIKATFTWKNKYGESFADSMFSGDIITNNQNVKLITENDTKNKRIYLKGIIDNYNFDFSTNLPQNTRYSFEITNSENSYKNLINFIDLKQIKPGTYKLVGNAMYKNLTWSIINDNINIQEGNFISSKPKVPKVEKGFFDLLIDFIISLITFSWLFN